jgi:predicted methyltransferase
MRAIVLFLTLFLFACGGSESDSSADMASSDEASTASTEPAMEAEPADEAMAQSEDAAMDEPEPSRLEAVLDEQPEDIQARYGARHPAETLAFFGIEPGMTVVEALPGGGWYTRILLPYLGSEGRLIAANYPLDLWPNFPFADEEFLANIEQWPDQFPGQAAEWCSEDCAPVSTFWLGELPAEMEGTADAVLFVRILHNMAAFQNAGIDDFADQAFASAFSALKPGGTLGVVQHEAREDMPDEWADGSAGYLKRSAAVEMAEAAGFELVEESDINANPNDQPTTEEVVWRLPPSLSVPEDAENRDTLVTQYEAIGESNRMTLKFRKPAEE